MASGVSVTKDEAKQFVEMFNEKHSIRAIAKKFDRSTSTVKTHLVHQGALKENGSEPAEPVKPAETKTDLPAPEPVVAPAAQNVPEPAALEAQFDRLLERLGLAADMEQETGRPQVHVGLCNSPHCAPCARVRKAVLQQTAQTVRKGTLQELATAAEWAGEVEAADRVYAAFQQWDTAGRPEPEDVIEEPEDDASSTIITITA